ncbi:MAG: protease modulator HflC [Chloroflexi bacterium]|nr:protease modulator HflC [Chloroflexota bacterium]
MAWIVIALVIVAWIVVPQFLYTVDVTKQAIVLQFGQHIATVDEPGLYVKAPFVQQVIHYEKRILASDALPGEYLTQDKKRLKVDHITRWKIVDPLKFYKTVTNETGARARLDPIVFSNMREELAQHIFSETISKKRDPIMDAVTMKTKEKVQEFGIEVVDVRIKRADLPKEVQASVFARMVAERQRMSKAYRSEGAEESAKIKADADKEKTIILADAYEKSQKLRGEGDAQATKTYAEAFQRDAEFYGFLRALESYEKFLVKDTTLVLRPDSELFRYLESSRLRE